MFLVNNFMHDEFVNRERPAAPATRAPPADEKIATADSQTNAGGATVDRVSIRSIRLLMVSIF